MKKSWLFLTWRQILIVGVMTVVLLFSVVPSTSALGPGSIISLMNTQRAGAGLSALSYNAALASSANAKAHDMLAKGYWSHVSPDGVAPWTFVSRAGYNYTAVAENLAKGFSTDGAVVSSWMASASHRANIMNGTYRDVGVAVVSGNLAGKPTTIIVAHFGATTAKPAPVATPATPKSITKPVASPTSAQSQQSIQAQQAAEQVTEKLAEKKPEAPKPKKPVELLIENLVKIIEPTEPKLLATK